MTCQTIQRLQSLRPTCQTRMTSKMSFQPSRKWIKLLYLFTMQVRSLSVWNCIKICLFLLTTSLGVNFLGKFQEIGIRNHLLTIRVNLLAPLLVCSLGSQSNVFATNAKHIFISSLSRFVSYPGINHYDSFTNTYWYFRCYCLCCNQEWHCSIIEVPKNHVSSLTLSIFSRLNLNWLVGNFYAKMSKRELWHAQSVDWSVAVLTFL
jgi:hypothetical protein